MTDEEKAHVVDAVLALHNDDIRAFMAGKSLRGRGTTKGTFRSRLERALEEGEVSYGDLVEELDRRDPWRKQNVFLLRSPDGLAARWANRDTVEAALRGHPDEECLRSKRALVLPPRLTIASIEHTERRRLQVLAYARRDHRERRKDLDTEERVDGKRLLWRAYEEYAVRSAVAFDWNLRSGHAMVRITKLPRETSYEDVYSEIVELMRDWLDVRRFEPLDLRRAISRLHEHDEQRGTEAKVFAVGYDTPGGRNVNARGSAADNYLSGEQLTDSAMREIRRYGSGQIQNVYWQPGATLVSQVHTFLVASSRRIEFTTDLDESTVNHVCERVRYYCR